MINEDKVELSRKRAELVENLTTPLALEERVRIQGELSVINARIKAMNTTAAARLKAAADRRKVAGMAEAQSNAARARANVDLQHHYRDDLACPACGTDSSAGCIANGAASDDDPAQRAAIDAWIARVLQRGGVKVRRARDGALDLLDAPAKWVALVDALCAGIHAAARGEELPEITAAEPKTKKRP